METRNIPSKTAIRQRGEIKLLSFEDEKIFFEAAASESTKTPKNKKWFQWYDGI